MEKTSEITIVTATAKPEKSVDDLLIVKSLNMHKTIFNHIVHYDNKQGLSKVYNEEFSKCTTPYVVFVHDDVFINDVNIENVIKRSLIEYDFAGVAGTASFVLDKQKTSAWHIMSQREHMVGEVRHQSNGRIWTTTFGPTNSRAVLFDGVLLALKTSSFQDTPPFDENFKFHHYDLSFCMKAYKAGKRGVCMPLSITHASLGDSMNTPEWRDSDLKFKELYY